MATVALPLNAPCICVEPMCEGISGISYLLLSGCRKMRVQCSGTVLLCEESYNLVALLPRQLAADLDGMCRHLDGPAPILPCGIGESCHCAFGYVCVMKPIMCIQKTSTLPEFICMWGAIKTCFMREGCLGPSLPPFFSPNSST